MTEKILILEGLNCASCANKIEDASKKISGVTNASFNFVSKKLKLNIDSDDENKIVSEVKNIVNSLEPDVKVLEDKKTEYKNKVLIMDGLD